MNKQIAAAEALANAVEDYVFTTEKNLEKLRAAWQGYVDVADATDLPAFVTVDADELERLLRIEQRLDAAIEDTFPGGELDQVALIAIREGAS